MIIFIGGPGSIGKTNLAYTLMKKLSIPYFSIDHLMMGIYRSNPNCGFTPMSDVKIINHYIWPIIIEMAKTNIENKHSLILEGFQILPENIRDIPDDYKKRIISIFLCFSENYINNSYNEIVKYRSIIESREDIDSKKIMVDTNKTLQLECEKNKIDYTIIDTQYLSVINQLVNSIYEKFNMAFHNS
jgi:2-phosphoglycerate kinase